MKNDQLYIRHILESIAKIKEYTKNGRDAFNKSSLIQDGVIRNFEIIGEATKKISADLKNIHPNVPWRQIAGLRDVLIHDYMGVDLTEVWNIIVNDLPDLENSLLDINKYLNSN